MVMCSRCKKRAAVVFITKMEGNEAKNEGLCLKCAKELLISLNSLGDLFLVDYGWDIKLSINNINEINKYLLDRKKKFSSLC